MMTFSTISNSELCAIIKKRIEEIDPNPNSYHQNTNSLHWKDILFQTENRNPKETVLILLDEDKFIIDYNSISDSRNSNKRLEDISTNYKRSMYDIYQAFWVELIHSNSYFQLFHNIASRFLDKINKGGVEETKKWGSTYSHEDHIDLLNNKFTVLKQIKCFYSFSIHLVIDNHKTHKSKFCDFSYGPDGVYLKIGEDEYLNIEFFKATSTEYSNLKQLDTNSIEKMTNIFVKYLDSYLPVEEGPNNLMRDFIHVINARFNLFDNHKASLYSLPL